MSFDITKLVDPPMPSYTFALYSRDLFEKSKFKDYDSLLENKIARSQARAKHLAWILESGNVTRPHESKRDNGNVPKTTSVQFLNAEYIATFNLGTDDHKFKRTPSRGASAGAILSCFYVMEEPRHNYRKLSTPRPHGAHESKRDNEKVPKTTSVQFANGEYVASFILGAEGATVTSFPEDFYDEFRDTFRKEVRGIPLYDAPLGNFDTCYMVDPGEVPTFPDVKMYFGHQNPENLLLLEQQRVMVHERGLFCLDFTKWKYPVALIGSYQLQGIGLTLHLDACN
ncbi:hypothetical protein MTR67_029850 [Solanum verrucosum]|uniref:Xylanase inhibitor C-terminal domain-containing protein n=1 Tax=Solanum verrucosum TaxID=315347 RepID=A0AAF0RBU4_SOLVR|nr:hypothetical protein MTR67_029850 [Solanum verrucosum]